MHEIAKDANFDALCTTLEKELGYAFHDRGLLEEALTHTSAVEGREQQLNSNERLEFLGDAVLELVMTDALFRLFPEATEGELTRRRSGIVCTAGLASCARKLNLGATLILGANEERQGGRDKDSMLENAVEAVIGAIFLDSDFDEVSRVVSELFAHEIANSQPTSVANGDYKSRLQEKVQAGLKLPIQYVVIGQQGPPHKPVFTVELRIGDKVVAKAKGGSKQQAQQNAAHDALECFDMLFPGWSGV